MPELQRNRQRDQKGFTLLEFLIAVMILSVAMLGMATLTGAMISYNKEAFDNTRAVGAGAGQDGATEKHTLRGSHRRH